MNVPTITVALVVAAVFLAIVVKGIINIKKGKGSCSCGCSECSMSDFCKKRK